MYCFICLSKEQNSTNFIKTKCDDVEFISKLNSCSFQTAWIDINITISICNKCYDNLQVAHDFVETCQKNCLVVKDYFTRLKYDNTETNNYNCNNLNRAILEGHVLQTEINQENNEYIKVKNEITNSANNDSLCGQIPEQPRKYLETESDNLCSTGKNKGLHVQINSKLGQSKKFETEIEVVYIKEEIDDEVCQVQHDYQIIRNELITYPQLNVYNVRNGIRELDASTSEVSDSDLLTNIDNKPHICTVCEKSFTYKTAFTKHMFTHSEKSRQCFVCQKVFTSKKNINRHMLIHTGERPHKCTICEKRFKVTSDLSRHVMIHTGERPNKCSMCDASFTVKEKLRRHMLVHTGEKPHKCVVCEKSFTSKNNLNTHMMVHTGERPHKCHLCEKSFTTRNNLNAHLIAHSGVKPHKCTYCEKSFTMKELLKRHLLTHTDEKPHKCAVCQRAFNQKNNLNKHMLTHIDK